MATTGALEQLAEEKEQELHLIRQQQAQAVQETLKGAQNELLLERQRLSQLQADFDYNLSLLSQRDEELAHYEKAFAELKRVINNLLAENSELKVRVDGLHTELEQGRQSQQQLKAHYVKRIEELHTQTEAYRHATQSEVERERGKLEQLQRRLEQRLLEVEGDIQCQRNHISAEFDELSRQREHEHQMKVSELNSQLLSKESQVKQLERERKMAQAARASSEEQAKGKENEVARMEREMRELQWRMEDTSSYLENRVAELQSQLEQTQAVARSQQEDFQKRHEELDRKVREKEACIKAAKEAHKKREGELELLVTELRAQLEGRESEIRRLLWEQEDTLKEKELQIQRCQEDLANSQSSLDDRIRGMSQELVARDLKLQTLEDMCDKLREDVRKRDTDIEHYKQEVSAGLQREKSLEQSKAQLQLDWEGRMEEIERNAYGKHQNIIHQLTQAKDKLALECEELRSTLEEQTGQLTATQQERDIAIATLNKHGLASQVTDHVMDHMTQLQHLRQQNEELHSVIRQMRQEIEQLAETPNRKPYYAPNQDDRSVLPTSGYIQYMENELIKIKSENRQLLERLQQAPPTGKPPTPSASPGRGGSSPTSPRTASASSAGERRQHRGHLIALSDTIASLQREKGALELTVVQLKSKVEELESSLNREQEQVYLLKACQVPQSKLHLKLLQATKVIIALVKEKKQLTAQLKEATTSLDRRKTPPINPINKQHRVQQCDKCIQTTRDSPRGHVQWTSQKSLESSIDQISKGDQSGSKATPSLSSGPNMTPLNPRSSHKSPQKQSRHEWTSPNNQHSIHDEARSSGQILPQDEQQPDISLASLKLTDSSLGESSLHQVLQMVERELSSSDNDRDVPMRHSTPEPPALESVHHQPLQEYREDDGRALELVGSKVVPRVHVQAKKHRQPQTVPQTSRSRTQNRTSIKPRVRNYNIRD